MFFQISWATSSMGVREKVTKVAVWVSRSWKGSSVWICWASEVKCKHLEANCILRANTNWQFYFRSIPDLPLCQIISKLKHVGHARKTIRMWWCAQQRAPALYRFAFAKHDLKFSDCGSFASTWRPKFWVCVHEPRSGTFRSGFATA